VVKFDDDDDNNKEKSDDSSSSHSSQWGDWNSKGNGRSTKSGKFLAEAAKVLVEAAKDAAGMLTQSGRARHLPRHLVSQTKGASCPVARCCCLWLPLWTAG